MATTIFNSLIVQASRAVQEYRTSAAASDDTGRVWKSANWTDYANRSIRNYIEQRLTELGVKKFMETYPEYVTTSGVLGVVAGSVARPADALVVLETAKSDYSIWYDRVPQSEIVAVKTGRSVMIVPSATRPVFWEESGNILTAGITAGNIVVRYIKTHTDLAVITTANGNGKKNTANGQYTALTALLKITMSSNFVAGDAGRKIMFYDNAAGKVYIVTIASRNANDEVYVTGTVLPAANIAAGDVTVALMEEVQDTDVVLNAAWHNEIIGRMTALALSDQANRTLT